MTTWAEFKRAVESQGVKDTDTVVYVTVWDPSQIEAEIINEGKQDWYIHDDN